MAPVGVRLDACAQVVERARNRLNKADEALRQAQEEHGKLEQQLREGERRLEELRVEASGQMRAAPFAGPGDEVESLKKMVTELRDSPMDEIVARLAALEQGVRERERDAHIEHLNNVLIQQQATLQAQSSGTSVPQADLHREMLARVKEFDGDDDKWRGWWWFELQSFLKANHLGYEALIDRIVHLY